jgi:site-specific DNA-methyltransferase (adenine-specific)
MEVKKRKVDVSNHVGYINTVVNEDCLVGMKAIESKSVHLILCDLPYGKIDCSWDKVLDMEKLWTEYKRVIKDDGIIILFGKHPFTAQLVMSNVEWFKYELIWEKDKPTNFAQANKQPMCYHENILVFYKKQPTYNKIMGEREGKGTWRYNFDISHENRKIQGTDKKYSGKKEKSTYDVDLKNPKSILYHDTGRRQHLIHPTQKPVSLFEWLIYTYTNENDIVMDNCMGSGTTAIACMKLNRKFIGFENNSEYHDICLKRIESFKETQDDTKFLNGFKKISKRNEEKATKKKVKKQKFV